MKLQFLKILFLISALYFLFVSLFTNPIADYDLWGYLAFGRIFWEKDDFLFHDVFSYTPTKALWVYHEWLTGVCFYPIYKYTGSAGLQLFRYVTVLLTIYLMYLTAIKRGGHWIWGIISLLPASLIISFGYVPVRAQIFTYLFFMTTLFILESVRKDLKWSLLWWLLPIQILWCNFHGGFLSGLGLIFLYGVGEGISQRKAFPFIMIGLIAILGTLVNPYGAQYWLYILQSVSMPRPEIHEWLSVLGALEKKIYEMPVYIFILSSAVCFTSYYFRQRQDKTDLIVLATTFYLGFAHIRHSVFFGLVFGSYLSIIMNEYWELLKMRGFRFANWPWIPPSILTVLMISLYVFINPSLNIKAAPSFQLLTPSPSYPTGAYKWMINNSFHGNILPHFEWGEFLIWYCYPFCRVAMDGRYETVYEDHVSQEYFLFLNGKEGGQYFLNKYPHDMVLIKANTSAERFLLADPVWEKVYTDAVCSVYLSKEWSPRKVKSP